MATQDQKNHPHCRRSQIRRCLCGTLTHSWESRLCQQQMWMQETSWRYVMWTWWIYNPGTQSFLTNEHEVKCNRTSGCTRGWLCWVDYDIIWLQVPECFVASYCMNQYNFLWWKIACAWHKSAYKDYSEMHSGSCSQVMLSCWCAIGQQKPRGQAGEFLTHLPTPPALLTVTDQVLMKLD